MADVPGSEAHVVFPLLPLAAAPPPLAAVGQDERPEAATARVRVRAARSDGGRRETEGDRAGGTVRGRIGVRGTAPGRPPGAGRTVERRRTPGALPVRVRRGVPRCFTVAG